MLSDNFFCILRVGLNICSITTQEFNALKIYSPKEWHELADLAVRQGVAGIFFDGIQQIYTTQGDLFPKEEWARELKARLFGITLQLEQRNRKQIAVMNKVGVYLKKHNCQMMVMKGQVCAKMYPNPLHRSIGDIDCYLYGNYALGNNLIRQTGINVDDSWYMHSEFCIEGETFENHQYFVTTRSGKRYKLLNKLLVELVTSDNTLQSSIKASDSLSVSYPPLMFNALFLTYHAYVHFITEGLRLKQVLDWVVFVKQHQEQIDWELLRTWCEEFKLSRFLIVMNTITFDVFGVEEKNKKIKWNSPFVDKVMDSVLYDNDYIFNTDKGQFTKRLHIISNMFKYRWKYRDICDENIIKLLGTKIVGLLFRTE